MGKGENGIDGFGGSYRNVAGVGFRRGNVEIAAVDPPFTTPDSMIDMLKYDSVHGQGNHPKLQVIFICGKPVAFLRIRDPGEIPWGETGAEVIDEFTGDEDKAAVLLKTDMFKYDSFHGQLNISKLKAMVFHEKLPVLRIRNREEIPWVETEA